MTPGDARGVAVVGAGSIGVAWAIVFARAGRTVRLWDAMPEAPDRARSELAQRLGDLDRAGLLRESPTAIAGRIAFEPTLGEACADAALVQECAPERVDVKRALFTEVAALAPGDAVLASSSSAIMPSAIAEGVPADAAERLLIGHPGNPPYLLPVVEIVPGRQTRPEVVSAAEGLYADAGMRPVVVRREVEGFVFNRLQGALLREAYCLVRDGVASVDEVDEVVRSGLGRRWSLIGPFETVDLNTRGGLASHAEKMGPAYARMGAERGQHDPWTPDLVERATAQRRELLPLEEWADRVRWRDAELMRHTPLWDGPA